MCYILYVAFMLFILGFGTLAVWNGLKGIFSSMGKTHNAEAFMLNFWGSLATLAIGIILAGFGIWWILNRF
jgi:hypothetical protein